MATKKTPTKKTAPRSKKKAPSAMDVLLSKDIKTATHGEVVSLASWRSQGNSWSTIASLFKKKFKRQITERQARDLFSRHGKDLFDAYVPEGEEVETGMTRDSLGEKLVERNVKRGRFVITAAVQAAPLHKASLAALEGYCKSQGAQLIIMPMRAHMRPNEGQPDVFDPALLPYQDLFATEFVFNSTLRAIEAHLNPQQIQPLTGLRRLKGGDFQFADAGNKEGSTRLTGALSRRTKTSIIIAHPKQAMEPLATGNTSTPRVIHTTGSITLPDYQPNRVGRIATEDHVLGALVVEIDGSKFWLRQLQMDQDGSFVDLGVRYLANGTSQAERAEAFVMGDLHAGSEDPSAVAAWKESFEILKPRRLFLHDVFDGTSVSHHLEKQRITKALVEKHFKTLNAEIGKLQEVLADVRSSLPEDTETVIVASNHDNFLARYLNAGRYIDDNVNFETAHRMVVATLDGEEPLQKWVDPQGTMTWLDRNQDFFVEGFQCGAHGDVAVNGQRGSPAANEASHGAAMVGHAHTPSIRHRLYTVGTTSHLRLGYNDGPSTWLHCSGVIYARGHRQLIVSIDGSWRLDDHRKKK